MCALKGADSTEFEVNTPHPVISLLEEQHKISHKGGTMRLGAQPCIIQPGTKAFNAYGREEISERHRHRYEFNNGYKEIFQSHGMIFSGRSPKDDLVEIMELKDHPWFLCVQFHPEFKSKPTNPHPLFKEFIRASIGSEMGVTKMCTSHRKSGELLRFILKKTFRGGQMLPPSP